MSSPSDPSRMGRDSRAGERPSVRQRRRLGLALAGTVVIAGGLGIGVVELLRQPRGFVWVVVAVTVGLVVLIRMLTARR